jgi:hypothetical protein
VRRLDGVLVLAEELDQSGAGSAAVPLTFRHRDPIDDELAARDEHHGWTALLHRHRKRRPLRDDRGRAGTHRDLQR